MHLVLPVHDVGKPGADEPLKVGGVGVGDLVGVQGVVVRSLRSGHVTSRVFEDERVAAVPPLARQDRTVRRDKIRQGKDKRRQDKTVKDKARQDKTVKDKTR